MLGAPSHSTAAAFLRRFIREDVAWAHLDIAGSGMASEARGPINAGGTGFGSQVIAEYCARYAEKDVPALGSTADEDAALWDPSE